MERSRESRRVASAPRRLRISCPKDPEDAEARMDETPLIEKVKKGNLQAFPASFPATAMVWSKRKRNGFQEAHNLPEGSKIGTQNYPESTPSDEYGNAAPERVVNSKQRTKKDELVMNICNIPRRARSSVTRIPFASAQQIVLVSPKENPSPTIFATKEEKLRQVGTKSSLLKNLRVSESTEISDEEVEIAEVLFGLSRTLPAFVQSTSGMCEERSHIYSEEEELNSTRSQIAGLENCLKSSGSVSCEQRIKRQRAFGLQKDSSCMPSTEKVKPKTGCRFSETPASIVEGSQVHKLKCARNAASDKNVNDMDERHQEHHGAQDNQPHSAEQIFNQDSLRLSINNSELNGQVFGRGGDCLKILSRNHKGFEKSGTIDRQYMGSMLENCTEKASNNGNVNKGEVGGDNSGWKLGLLKAVQSPGNREQEYLRVLNVKDENTWIPCLCQEAFSGGVSSPLTVNPSSDSTTTSMGWMGALPQLCLNRKPGPLGHTKCLHSGSSLVQVPHAASAQHYVRRMRRCATHVCIARFIQQQQQLSRRPFWSPACNRNFSPASLQGKEHWSMKIPPLQAEEHRRMWAENFSTSTPNSRGTVNKPKNENFQAGYNNSAHVLSDDAELMSTLTTAQYKQSTLHSNRPSTTHLTLNGSPDQNPSIFNKELHSARVSSQNCAQQASGLMKYQEVNHVPLHVGLSHSPSTQPQAQIQQETQQLKQQHSCLPMPQLYGGAGCGAFLEGNRLGFR